MGSFLSPCWSSGQNKDRRCTKAPGNAKARKTAHALWHSDERNAKGDWKKFVAFGQAKQNNVQNETLPKQKWYCQVVICIHAVCCAVSNSCIVTSISLSMCMYLFTSPQWLRGFSAPILHTKWSRAGIPVVRALQASRLSTSPTWDQVHSTSNSCKFQVVEADLAVFHDFPRQISNRK